MTEKRAVTLLREKESSNVILRELMKDVDFVMQVDCASTKVHFVVSGWFCFPPGSLTEPVNPKLDKPA